MKGSPLSSYSFIQFICLTKAADVVVMWDNPMISNITIYVGDTVHWVTSDNQPHTVTSYQVEPTVGTPAPFINSPLITSDENGISQFSKRKFSKMFTQEGLHYYHDQHNPDSMQGTVHVIKQSRESGIENSSSKETIESFLFASLLAFLIFFVFS
ncbi:hypothetical protein PPL_09439 [Heterostelium album PN500]|uniref:Uncharacterized protein n=1 Tax=Heterostelium pallidum (strain ATCC 26659 / Pp 5 / PN500) TaxID=670386 RepID=D3BPH1_HETP5|nr:hypothetical protein PPL_09439 [Heterostelium album PN500]EFA76689.1 hypothetical protein PPL_09439 [Heterostelium album PN500]|eukprot:XP_020428821.1 hypothetical protein PPL_09439 [Heterostelium album PN500]